LTVKKLNLFHFLQIPQDFEGQGNDAYQLRVISDWAYASVTRPALLKDASEVFVGASGAHLGGWAGADNIIGVLEGEQQNISPAWDLSLDANKGNATQRKC
jgi:hypothetical protein